MTTRIYAINPKTGDAKPRLVRASHPAVALSHVAKTAFTVEVASQDQLVKAFEAGVKVENVGGEQTELPTT